jgi:hypothetical protein
MRKIIAVGMLMAFVAASAFAATPDPWRIRVTDLDPNAPHSSSISDNIRFYSVYPEDGFSSAGGTIRVSMRDYDAAGNPYFMQLADYTATTGALTYGTATDISVEGLGYTYVQHFIKVGAVYKTWTRWLNAWTGHSIQYSTSSDGANFSAPLQATVYGSTNMATDGYGHFNGYRTSGGTYVMMHGNSFASYQGSHAKALMTSGVGETVWYDIDIDSAGRDHGYKVGDTIMDPHTIGTWYHSQENQGHAGRACDGNLIWMTGHLRDHVIGGYGGDPAAQYYDGRGMSLTVGTIGEASGGDEYVFIADADNTNTEGIGNSVLSAIGLNGLSGPSLRSYSPTSTWRSWYGFPVGLQSSQQTPSARFALIYYASWDTDSSDGTFDVQGLGRAKMDMTRNKADLNYDGTVNFQDIGPFSGAYGSSSGQPLYNPDADFNSDGKVDFQDIGPLSGRYGSDCSFTTP